MDTTIKKELNELSGIVTEIRLLLKDKYVQCNLAIAITFSLSVALAVCNIVEPYVNKMPPKPLGITDWYDGMVLPLRVFLIISLLALLFLWMYRLKLSHPIGEDVA